MDYASNQDDRKVVKHAVEVVVSNLLELEIDTQILNAFMEVGSVFNPTHVDVNFEGEKIAAEVPPNLVVTYKDKDFAQTFVSIHHFQVGYVDPTQYPRYQNYSFLRRDWFIAVNFNTIITETLSVEETGFNMHPWLPSIRSLVGEKIQRKMLNVNLLVDTGLTGVEFDTVLRQVESLMNMTI
ncbi:hypothetical protein Tco_0401364 [Tanacetum coccineum]